MKKRLLFSIFLSLIVSSFTLADSDTKNTTPEPVIALKRNADVSSIKNKILDVKYAEISPTQTLDVYIPSEGKGPFPLIIKIHGGGFEFGSKESGLNETAIKQGVERGYVVATINYRKSGEAKFPAAIQDVKAAIRYLRANASKYEINPDKIALWGESAGGNLAALAGTTNGNKIFDEENLGNIAVSSDVQAVVDWFGPTNFGKMDDQFKEEGIDGQVHNIEDSFESKYLGAHIQSVPELVIAANPETYISKVTPPFLIQHGTADNAVPFSQSKEFAEKLKSELGDEKVTFIPLEKAGHGTKEYFESESNINIVFDFLNKYLK